MLEMTYPDGEVLNYTYDSGGLLKQAYGTKRGNKYWYIKNLIYDEFGQRTRIEYGNGVYTTYTYDTTTRRLSHLLTVENAKKRKIQEISYTYDLVGNIMNTNNTAPVPAGGEHGGPTDQSFTYDDLYQLVTADGAHRPGENKRTTYNNRFAYDIIGNITWKFQNHKVLHGTDSATEPRETNYDMAYKYTGPQPHAVTDAGDKLYTYDPNGNMLGWTSKTSGAKRSIVWNEENRVKSVADSGSTTVFLYNDAGERVVKRGQHGESVYINRFYSVKNGDLGSKHIFAGETRIVTKLEKDGGSLQSGVPGSIALERSQGLQNAILQGNGQKKGIERRLAGADGSGGTVNPPIEKFQFFYHGDHLGSSSFITDDAGAVYQHLEYFPYGETWVESGGGGHTPGYKFTGKELDPETGLYYYGARYYDPVLSRWISADPILSKYVPSIGEESYKLPGIGGIFHPANLGLYTYTHHNPIKLTDPTGNDVAIPKYFRWSRAGDYGHNPDNPYFIIGYEVYNYDTHQDYLAAIDRGEKLDRPTASVFEMTFEARAGTKLPGKDNIMGDTAQWKEMHDVKLEYGWERKHQFSITDIGKGRADTVTTDRNGKQVNWGAIRFHPGGPYWSEGCGTSPCAAFLMPNPDKPDRKIGNKPLFEWFVHNVLPSTANKYEPTEILIPPANIMNVIPKPNKEE